MSSIERFANPTRFMRLQTAIQPWVWMITLALFGVGLYLGLTRAPADYQQGETVRIMYVHVPAAWAALMVYTVMAVASIIGIVFRHPLADIAAKAAAPLERRFAFWRWPRDHCGASRCGGHGGSGTRASPPCSYFCCCIWAIWPYGRR